MTTHLLADSATMFRRNLLRMIRYPGLTMFLIAGPPIFLLLFVFVFGNVMGAGLPGMDGVTGGRSEYLAFIAPTIIIIAVLGGAQGTAITIAMDMTSGLVARFKTMAIGRSAVLNGHVLGSVVQAVIATVVLVGVALLIGLRPTAGVGEWLTIIGLITLIAFALTWLVTAMGMAAKTVESASNLPMPLLLLPFFGSGFVPTETLPAAIRWFAQIQPFTPFIDSIRSLLFGQPVGNSVWLTVSWCLVIGAIGYLWSMAQYNRKIIR